MATVIWWFWAHSICVYCTLCSNNEAGGGKTAHRRKLIQLWLVSTAAAANAAVPPSGGRRNTISSTAFFPLFAIAKDLDFPHESTRIHTPTHKHTLSRRSTPLLAAADLHVSLFCCWCWMLLWFRRTYKASRVTHFCTFLLVNRLFAFHCHCIFFFFFFLFSLSTTTFQGNFLLFCLLFVFLQTTLSVLFACFARFFANHTTIHSQTRRRGFITIQRRTMC